LLDVRPGKGHNAELEPRSSWSFPYVGGVLRPVMDTNPFVSPASQDDPSQNGGNAGAARQILRAIGTWILNVGLAALAYGALAFWIIPILPPNGGVNGRLPSLFVMLAGIVATLVGMVLRGVQLPWRPSGQRTPTRKALPTSVGFLLILAIVIAVIVAISRM
jgi:hypothetical protein